MDFPKTQAEWPSLAPGTVPEILGVYHLCVSTLKKNRHRKAGVSAPNLKPFSLYCNLEIKQVHLRGNAASNHHLTATVR